MNLDPVLFLHGQPGGGRDWAGVIDALGGMAPAIAIDRPGWSDGTRPGGLAHNAGAALAAVDARGAERATVVGHSLGAGVAAWLGVHHPERVRALVLVAPAASTAAMDRVDRLLAAPALGELMSGAAMAGVGATLAVPLLRRRIARGLGLDEAYLRFASRRLLSGRGRRAFVCEQRALFEDLPVLEQKLHRIAAPTTIVAGTADWIVPVSAARALRAEIPGAELVLIRGATHLLPHQHPARLAEIISSQAKPR